MRCEQCGWMNPTAANYCRRCGNPFHAEEPEAPAPAEEEALPAGQPAKPQPNEEAPEAEGPESALAAVEELPEERAGRRRRRRHRNSRACAVWGFCLAVAAVPAGVFMGGAIAGAVSILLGSMSATLLALCFTAAAAACVLAGAACSLYCLRRAKKGRPLAAGGLAVDAVSLLLVIMAVTFGFQG
jgi:hypothetical protein